MIGMLRLIGSFNSRTGRDSLPLIRSPFSGKACFNPELLLLTLEEGTDSFLNLVESRLESGG